MRNSDSLHPILKFAIVLKAAFWLGSKHSESQLIEATHPFFTVLWQAAAVILLAMVAVWLLLLWFSPISHEEEMAS